MRETRLLPMLFALAGFALACGNAQPAAGGGGGGGTICTACHGGLGPAPYFQAGTDPNLAAAPPAPPPNKPQAVIGAHQSHVNPNPASSPPPLSFPRSCDECHHPVPTDSAHSAGPPAFPTVVFNGIALGPSVTTDGTNPGTPTWNGTDTATGITTPTCSAVYCHGSFEWFGDGASGANVTGNAFTPDWTIVDGSQAACGTCHDLPPMGHIQNAFIGTSPTAMVCNGCHPGTVDASGNIIVDAQTGLSNHINGLIDEGAHTDPNWYVPTSPNGGDHGFAAIQAANGLQYCEQCHTGFNSPLEPPPDPGDSCNSCHNTTVLTGAATPDWQQNCVFCHGDKTQILTWAAPATTTIGPLWAAVAPPVGPLAETGTTTLAVGAHQQHVGSQNTLSVPFACTECHTPTLPTDITHVDGQPVPVQLMGLTATSGTVQGTWNLSPPTCSSTYCHGNFFGGNNAAPNWTQVDGTFSACTSCHGGPLSLGNAASAAPNDGQHPFHVGSLGFDCSACHPTGYSNLKATPTTGTVVTALHVNGVVDLSASAGYSCGLVGCQPRGGQAFGTCTNSCHPTGSPGPW